jgi:hypothetical protein
MLAGIYRTNFYNSGEEDQTIQRCIFYSNLFNKLLACSENLCEAVMASSEFWSQQNTPNIVSNIRSECRKDICKSHLWCKVVWLKIRLPLPNLWNPVPANCSRITKPRWGYPCSISLLTVFNIYRAICLQKITK